MHLLNSVFRGPAAAAWLVGLAASSVALVRAPAPATAGSQKPVKVLAEQIVPTMVPPPLPSPAPTPVPEVVPRVVSPRPPGARVRGTHNSAPRAIDGYIQIPSIGANARLVAVGLDTKGLMVTPKNAKDVAWLDNGTFPGPTNNAVLAGHRNWSGAPGSFIKLEQAKPGDVVIVAVDGRRFTFAIRWVRVYDPRTAPVDELLGDTSVDSVTLVTCGGPFDSRSRHYTKRVVARAELVEFS